MYDEKNNIAEVLKKKINIIEGKLSIIEDFKQKECKGSLEYRCINGRVYYRNIYYQNKKRFCETIYEDDAKILATKKYYRIMQPLLERELKNLKKRKFDIDEHEKYEIYDKLPEVYQLLVTPLFETAMSRVILWEREPYLSNPFRTEMRVFQTTRGEYVRSSEEKMIADILYENRNKYKYKYEQRLELTVDYDEVYPDFEIISLQTGEVYYLEHFGMLDKESYFKKSFVEKINRYIRNGIYPGKQLIITYSGMGTELSRKMINDALKLIK